MPKGTSAPGKTLPPCPPPIAPPVVKARPVPMSGSTYFARSWGGGGGFTPPSPPVEPSSPPPPSPCGPAPSGFAASTPASLPGEVPSSVPDASGFSVEGGPPPLLFPHAVRMAATATPTAQAPVRRDTSSNLIRRSSVGPTYQEDIALAHESSGRHLFRLWREPKRAAAGIPFSRAKGSLGKPRLRLVSPRREHPSPCRPTLRRAGTTWRRMLAPGAHETQASV